jgi:beta-lactamase superfamily II metal-dependent hydrolase/N-acetylmuramoyl-L-alanine amidase CwlA/3D (Asp-Asp-Asp) domain-containing protein
MPVLDGDGNAVPGATSTPTSSTGTLKINTSKQKAGKGAITPQYIVIHNTAGGTASSNADWFCSGAGGSGNCTQFITDDKEIYQIMPPTQKAQHIQGSNTGGGKGCSSWSNTLAPALSQCGATNSNSIGIEVADAYNPSTNSYDNSKVDMAKAVELTIELTRYLMKQYNIPIDNVVRHGDTHNKDCPMRIMQLNLWPYFKEQCQKRNDENKPVSFDPSTLDTSGQPSGGGTPYNTIQVSTGGVSLLDTPLYAIPTDIEVQLPDVDHRENTTNMDEVKGVTVIFYPPYNSCAPADVETHFKTFNWDRTYHYLISKQGIVTPPGGGAITPDTETPEDDTEIPEGETPDIEATMFSTRASSNKAHIYSVEDGLCVLIQNDGVNTLIDCAEINKAKSKGVIQKIQDLGVTKLDNVIITHFHSDHVAGFKDFAEAFSIGNVYYKELDKSKLSDQEVNWKTGVYYDEVVSICESKNIKQNKVTKDLTVSGIKVFAGDTSDNYNNYNRQSLSMIAPVGNNKLFIAGDIIEDTENMILDSLEECDAMIIAHHAYDGSNGQAILDKVNPKVFFVTTFSTTQDNQKAVIERVNNKNNEFYSTHSNGDVITLEPGDDGFSHNATVKVVIDPNEIPEGDPVGGDKTLEAAEGFEIKAWYDETRQTQGFTDNDTHTYIDRALFQNKREKHNLTVALICPENEEDYPAYEKALIEGLSIILHEHGLGIKDLWREFDLNRAPSPFLYLDRDNWKDLLVEIEKQLNWRIAKFGSYSKVYVPYTAGSSGLSGGSTGSIGTPSTGIGTTPGVSNPIQGPTEMKSENEVVNICYATFIGLGFTPEAACAVIGNIQQESGLKPTAVNSSSGATGLCQWLSARLDGLKNYAASKGTQWTDVATQCEWAWEECKGKDSTTKSLLDKNCGGPDSFKSLTDISKAVDLWRKCFERCGEHEANDAKRLQYANNWYSQIVKTDSGNTGGGGTLPPLEEASLEPVLFTIQPRTPLGPDEGASGGSTSTGTSTNSSIFGWPLPGIDKVSSKFGPRTPPCKGASSMHGGIDIGASSGTPIMAYASGTVVQNVAWNKSAGNYIKIDHGNGVASRYLHMVEPSPLAVGTTVQGGQEVGKVGNSGVGTGAHLHFEIHINDEKVDPLLYVNPGGGTKDSPNIGSPVVGTPVVSPGTGGGSIGTIGPDSDNLLYEDKQQDKTNAPIEGNSAGGQNHSDWGGKMVYKKGEGSEPNAEQPAIETVITKEMYTDIMQYSDPSLIDDYVMDFEPYSKGLASIDDNQITMNDRINAMTKQFITKNENTFHYKVIESGPGSKDHCVTIAEELNYLAVPQDLMVEPIYPDLVIPPGYISTDVDTASPNSIPIAVIDENGATSSDAFTKQLSFDYDLLQDKVKQSNKRHHPVNYTDPYPYDDKITDLERHYPKVFIDEIEGQLYSCNHPGCPISQPMAKNFAMVSDALMNQSKRIEKRLTRIENILSTIIRNQGRLGSRMNINCVYYGGHSTFNKYKCIRCLHDDRIHDGELVTIDQCLNCTRFEPILGQVYRILDDSGLNGSIILDDMQMSYTDLQGFKNLNDITCRSSRYFNAMATDENNCKKPEKTLIDIWKEADKEQAIETIRAESTDQAEAQKQIDALKEEDYIFKMNWAETFFNSQEPDTKLFPNEGIIARQKADVTGDGSATIEDTIAELDPILDADVIEELKERIKIRDNIWIDTRNKADSIQMNKYSSENFFFEDFNKVRIGKYGIKFSALYNYNGEDYNNVYTGAGAPVFGGSPIQQLNGSNPGSVFASQVRDKIVEMAKKIFADCEAGKAWYSQDYRTTEYEKPVTIKAGNGTGKTGYDCTSFVSCCYMYAGLKSMYAKSCSGGTLIREIQQGGKMIPCNKDNMQYILPGDILITASGTVTQNDCNQLKFFTSSHAAIYVGNNQIIHARGKDKGIQATGMDYYLTKGNYVFVRPADLLAADLAASQQQQTTGGSGGVDETPGTINGQSYVAKIPQAVCTAYSGDGQGANGPLVYNAHCASHNIPYGTKIYIPDLAGQAGNGIFTVQDTGGCFFDFDIYTTTWGGKKNMDAYVLEWGSGKTAASYTWAINFYLKNGRWSGLVPAWNTYKNMNGKLMNFTKYNQEDVNIKSHPNYND